MSRKPNEFFMESEAYARLATALISDAIHTVKGEMNLRHGFGNSEASKLLKHIAPIEDFMWLLDPEGGILLLEHLGIEDPFGFICKAIMADERPGETNPPPRRERGKYQEYYDD